MNVSPLGGLQKWVPRCLALHLNGTQPTNCVTLCLHFLICEMLLWISATVNYMQTVVFVLCLVHGKA